jgi:hypothetical protein
MPPVTFSVSNVIVFAALPKSSADPHPDDPRKPYFLPNNQKTKDKDGLFKNPIKEDGIWASSGVFFGQNELYEDISKTLDRAGFETNTRGLARPSIYQGRFSKKHPSPGRYVFFPIEVISPAMELNEEAISYIREVYATLTNTYRTFINPEYTLQVQVGIGGTKFTDDAVKRLIAILWSYEPLIENLHPLYRIKWGLLEIA